VTRLQVQAAEDPRLQDPTLQDDKPFKTTRLQDHMLALFSPNELTWLVVAFGALMACLMAATAD
jgi:hypothetical protein